MHKQDKTGYNKTQFVWIIPPANEETHEDRYNPWFAKDGKYVFAITGVVFILWAFILLLLSFISK